MTDPLSEWLDEMEAKARAATPGPYTTDYDRNRCLIDGKGHIIALTYDRDFFSPDTSLAQSQANAAYLAALPPETVQALVECVRLAMKDPEPTSDMLDALARLRRPVKGEG